MHVIAKQKNPQKNYLNEQIVIYHKEYKKVSVK